MKDIYRQFLLATQEYEHPAQYGYDWFCAAIDKVYEAKQMKINWLDLEQMSHDLLASTRLTSDQKVRLSQDAWNAYTGR